MREPRFPKSITELKLAEVSRMKMSGKEENIEGNGDTLQMSRKPPSMMLFLLHSPPEMLLRASFCPIKGLQLVETNTMHLHTECPGYRGIIKDNNTGLISDSKPFSSKKIKHFCVQWETSKKASAKHPCPLSEK